MKESFYFPHDTSAHTDPKLMSLFMKTGLGGIGLYWIIIELLHQQEDGMIKYEQFEDYIRWYSAHEKIEGFGEKIISTLFSTELFIKTEDELVFSKRVLENKKIREEKSKKAKSSASARWGEVESQKKPKDCMFYVLKFSHKETEESFIKCGITTISLSSRFGGKIASYSYEVLYQKDLDTTKALSIESLIGKKFVRYRPIEKFGGYLECYSIEKKNEILQTIQEECDCIEKGCETDAIKEIKGKEIKGNSIENIYTKWNEQKICEHRNLDPFIKEIEKSLKKFSEEEILKAIENYGLIFRNPKCFFKYKWTLREFLSRKNGMQDFLYKTEADYISTYSGAPPKKTPVTMTEKGKAGFDFFG